jgi:hypothetical protein
MARDWQGGSDGANESLYVLSIFRAAFIRASM